MFQNPLEAFGGVWQLKKACALQYAYTVRTRTVCVPKNFLLYRATMKQTCEQPAATRQELKRVLTLQRIQHVDFSHDVHSMATQQAGYMLFSQSFQIMSLADEHLQLGAIRC